METFVWLGSGLTFGKSSEINGKCSKIFFFGMFKGFNIVLVRFLIFTGILSFTSSGKKREMIQQVQLRSLRTANDDS